ncbi:MAG: BamA/TamA family outer membrane protein [Ignavibacteria bacterium]|nr:BamA/TamA family outer membrane protein [Ignavibacteria bacterium]
MILRIKYFLLLALYPFLMLSQVVDKIEVNTNTRISESEIISWAQTGKGSKIYKGILDSLKSRIAFNLSLRGFFNPEFEGSKLDFSADSQKVNIVLNIEEGEPTFISNVNFTSNDSLQLKTFLPVFQFLQGQVFDKNEIEEYINDALTRLENNGHPFAVFTITSVHFYYDSTEDKNFTDLYIKLNTGNESKIDKIEVQGNESTRDYVVIRELRIVSGEQYSQDKIEELPRRLNRLRFFEPVTTPQFYMDSDDNGVLLITVKERQTNNFDGIIGYVPPSNEKESGFITGLVNVSLRNLFGTGRAAAFRWRKIDRNSQELELKYLEPWLLGFPLNLNVDFFQRQQDTIYVQTTISGGLEYLATEDVSAAVFVASESTIPTLSEELVFTVFNSTSLTTGINLKIDTRDDPLAPISGILFINSYKFSRKNINGPSEFITPDTETEINLQRFEATLALFFELFRRQVIAFDINGRELRGPFFEESDLYRLGGTNSLRGYREDQFLGNRIYWTNLEYRFFLSRRTFAFLFFDTGYFLRNADEERNILKQEAFKIGYGLGINLETAIGVLGVSFALAKGDSFSDGLIHFGIINEF